MSQHSLNVREIPPAERHPKIHAVFDTLESGEALTIINDHEPKPLFYEFQAEKEEFDVDNYDVVRVSDDEFIATFGRK